MMRCKPLLGTFVEISTGDSTNSLDAIENAFKAIEKIQDLMGLHQADTELSCINALAHIEPVQIHPWTAQVLTIALEIYRESGGLFNCGIGHHLVEAQLLPQHSQLSQYDFGSLENLYFLDATTVRSDLPLCLDLGGIAKGFAVDIAVEILKSARVASGCVNAGGDFRVFGNDPQAIHIRNPANPQELIYLGELAEGALATSSLYFAKRDMKMGSYMVNAKNKERIDFSDSYSVIARECIYADALTKVVCISENPLHPCLHQFSAQAIRVPIQ